MFEKDNSMSMIDAKVSEVKGAVRLDPESQSIEYDGHGSADYGSGPDKAAAGPQGVGE